MILFWKKIITLVHCFFRPDKGLEETLRVEREKREVLERVIRQQVTLLETTQQTIEHLRTLLQNYVAGEALRRDRATENGPIFYSHLPHLGTSLREEESRSGTEEQTVDPSPQDSTGARSERDVEEEVQNQIPWVIHHDPLTSDPVLSYDQESETPSYGFARSYRVYYDSLQRGPEFVTLGGEAIDSPSYTNPDDHHHNLEEEFFSRTPLQRT